jgi:hypothetical protein
MATTTRSRRSRRQFDDDFKTQAVRQMLDEGKTAVAVAREAGDPKEGGGLLRERAAVRFGFIAAEKAHHSLELLCRCLRVTRSVPDQPLIMESSPPHSSRPPPHRTRAALNPSRRFP